MGVEIEELSIGDTVIISHFDDTPEHRFLIASVEEDCVTGTALTGPLKDCYGEPPIELIKEIIKN